MAFPSIAILNAYLKAYEDHLTTELAKSASVGSVLTGIATSLVLKARSFVSPNEYVNGSVAEVKRTKINAFKERIRLATTPTARVELIHKLGEEARNAKSGEVYHTSLYIQTFHALRTRIIDDMESESKSEDYIELAAERRRRQTIKTESLAKVNHAKAFGINPNPTDVNRYHDTLIALADLGDREAILEMRCDHATHQDLFKTRLGLEYPDESYAPRVYYSDSGVNPPATINKFIPWLYQSNFYKIFYHLIQHGTYPSNEDVQKLIANYSDKLFLAPKQPAKPPAKTAVSTEGARPPEEKKPEREGVESETHPLTSAVGVHPAGKPAAAKKGTTTGNAAEEAKNDVVELDGSGDKTRDEAAATVLGDISSSIDGDEAKDEPELVDAPRAHEGDDEGEEEAVASSTASASSTAAVARAISPTDASVPLHAQIHSPKVEEKKKDEPNKPTTTDATGGPKVEAPKSAHRSPAKTAVTLR